MRYRSGRPLEESLRLDDCVEFFRQLGGAVEQADERNLDLDILVRVGGRLHVGLDNLSATDEGLFATADYLSKGAADVDILVEEIIATAREITQNPAAAVEFRKTYKLLPDLGPEADAEIAAYYEETAKAGALPLNGGIDAAADDFGFFSLAGQIEGDPATLKVEDFWDLAPLDRALAKLGKK